MADTYFVQYLWDFGDGTVSKDQSPVHVYKMPGVYYVQCRVWDELGNTWLSERSVVYVYNWAYGIPDGINVSITDYCLRFAIPQSRQQGIGWSVYDDIYDDERTYEWPYPEGLVGTCVMLDAQRRKRYLVIDSRTFRHYEVGIEDNWRQREGDYAGSEIESEITWREHEAPVGASAILDHAQSHLNFKPWFKDRRSTSDYDARGYRSGFHADLYMRKDSEASDATISKAVPQEGQIVFDRHVQSKYLQLGVKIRVAPWRLPSVQQWFRPIDKGAPPALKQMSEKTWAEEFQVPVLWVSRYSAEPLLDLASGAAPVSGSATASVTGPDGYSGSGLFYNLAHAGFPTYTFTPLAADATFIAWILPTDTPARYNLFSDPGGEFVLRLIESGDEGMSLQYVDAENHREFVLGALTSWTQIALVREGAAIRAYQNGSLINSASIESTIATLGTGGTLELHDNNARFFDSRVYGSAVSGNAIEFLYEDVTQHNGNTLCPVM